MVTEQYVSFETAKMLKDKGFDECIYTCYSVEDYPQFMTMIDFVVQDEVYERIGKDCHIIQAPTQQMAMRWLREQHNLHIDIDISDGDWNPCVIELENWSVVSEYDTEKTQDTYEDAVEYALKYCLTKLL